MRVLGTRRFTDRYPFFGPAMWMLAIVFFVAQVVVAYRWESMATPSVSIKPNHPYSFFGNSISDLGETSKFHYGHPPMWSPLHVWMNLAFILLGGLMILGSLAVYHEFTEGTALKRKAALVGFSAQGLAGAGAIVVGLVPENTHPLLHEVGAGAAIAVGTTGVLILGLALPLPARLRRFMLWTSPVSLVAILLFVLHEFLGFGPGGVERIAAYPEVIWLISFGFYISHSHRTNASAHRLAGYGGGRLRLAPRGWLPLGRLHQPYSATVGFSWRRGRRDSAVRAVEDRAVRPRPVDVRRRLRDSVVRGHRESRGGRDGRARVGDEDLQHLHPPVTDDEFVDSVVAVCTKLADVEAVALGGSRARGDNRPDSDWDFAVYYRGEIDVALFESTGWEGTVYRPFDWGQVMYGGAVFDLDGRHFDIHYRNLDVVEHWTREAERGRFEVHILGFHLAGIPTYMLAGELATNRVLWGELPKPAYPELLRQSAPPKWLQRAAGEISYSHHWAQTANPINCAGALARAVLQCAHARLAARAVWALNEKRMVEWADLTDLYGVFAEIGSSPAELERAVSAVAEVSRLVSAEVGLDAGA